MRRLVPVLVVALSLTLLVTGCVTIDGTSTLDGPDWKNGGTAGATEEGTDPADGIAFDEGLPDGTTVEWADTMFADDDFTVAEPDDGEGHWAYRQESSGCTIAFWQTRADGLEPVGDEVARSESTLASFLGWEIGDVEGAAFDASIAVADGAVFDVRAVAGDDGGTDSWVALARAFDGPDEALALDVTCPLGTDALTQMQSLMPDFVAARIS